MGTHLARVAGPPLPQNAAEPFPATVTMVELGSTRRTTWLPASTTKTPPSPSASSPWGELRVASVAGLLAGGGGSQITSADAGARKYGPPTHPLSPEYPAETEPATVEITEVTALTNRTTLLHVMEQVL